MIWPRKFAEVFQGGGTVCFASVLDLFKVPEEYLFAPHFDSRRPFSVRLVPVHAAITGCVISLHVGIRMVLGNRGWSKIFSPIIEAVSVLVIYVGQVCRANLTVHVNQRSRFFSVPPDCVEAVGGREPVSAPIPLVEPIKVCRVNDGDLPLGQWDVSDRLILRLNDRLAVHAALGHNLTSNEIAAVQPHRHFIRKLA
jgi:hypothetical protein